MHVLVITRTGVVTETHVGEEADLKAQFSNVPEWQDFGYKQGYVRPDGLLSYSLLPANVVKSDDPQYLVCDCGEAFDSLTTATSHKGDDDEHEGEPPSFTIQPESEAI